MAFETSSNITPGPSKFDRLPKSLASIREFSASKGILLFLIGGLLYVARAAFIPVALALLFALILSSPVERLHRLGASRGLSAIFILVLAIGAVSSLLALTWYPVQSWYASAPHTLSVIQDKITPVARLMRHFEDLSNRAGAMGSDASVGNNEPTVALAQQGAASAVLASIRDGTTGVAAFIIMTLFLLTGGPPMAARMTAAFFDHLKANHVQRTIEKVRAQVAHYYIATAMINLCLGVTTTLVMMAWHMPTPYLWGAMAALLSFIPYAGAAATWAALTIVAIVSFEGLGHAIGVSFSYLCLATIEGQLLQPLLIGRRLKVNPLLIFAGLWFGGFFWGVAGVILATPMLVALKVIAADSLDGKSMTQFLGPNEEEPLEELQNPSNALQRGPLPPASIVR